MKCQVQCSVTRLLQVPELTRGQINLKGDGDMYVYLYLETLEYCRGIQEENNEYVSSIILLPSVLNTCRHFIRLQFLNSHR